MFFQFREALSQRVQRTVGVGVWKGVRQRAKYQTLLNTTKHADPANPNI